MPSLLTPEEKVIFARFRNFPKLGSLRITDTWIVEWLSTEVDERRTGEKLFRWAESQWPDWAKIERCNSKNDVLDAIKHATSYAAQCGRLPMLHIEAHGNDQGISPRANANSEEFLYWGEITEPLQALNLATRCNLLVMIAACFGISGITALNRGPRAPAVVIVGPKDKISEKSLLDATKEFYRRIRDANAYLPEILQSVSAESGDVPFVDYSFVDIAYDSIVSDLIASLRPEVSRREKEQLRDRLMDECGLTFDETQSGLAANPDLAVEAYQKIWDQLFCLDLFPENYEQFGLDMAEISRVVRGNC